MNDRYAATASPAMQTDEDILVDNLNVLINLSNRARRKMASWLFSGLATFDQHWINTGSTLDLSFDLDSTLKQLIQGWLEQIVPFYMNGSSFLLELNIYRTHGCVFPLVVRTPSCCLDRQVVLGRHLQRLSHLRQCVQSTANTRYTNASTTNIKYTRWTNANTLNLK